jgi:uncharacterized protein YdhG (YjbR/CyaY superfamily)
MQQNYSSVDEYINMFSNEVQVKLRQLQSLILETVPHAQGYISYKMPAYKINNKPIIYFAAYPKHIGLYALPTAHAWFKDAFNGYKQGKGSVQLPHITPLPIETIRQVLLFNLQKINAIGL